MKSVRLFFLFSALFAFTFSSCNKEGRTANIQVRMKDNPIDLQEVNVEILEVKMHVGKKENDTTDNDGWISLATNEGIYNLLELQDGITDTLVDESEIPVGYITQMRLVLGDENTIMVDSTIYELDTPSGQSSGLKFKVNGEIKSGKTYDLLFDFDAEKSIVEKGNDSYSLKPVLKLVELEEK